MAIILNEPNRDIVITVTNNAMLLSPEVIPFEIGNALANLYKRKNNMKMYNYSEARHNFSTVLNTALKEEVIIARKDGSKFKLVSIQESLPEGKSPLASIKGVQANVTMDDILEAIREGRERK